MAGLVSKKIKDSYKSLIRVDDDSNGLDGSLANITDGAGNTGPFQMSRTAVEFTSGTSLTLGASTALNTRQVNAPSGTLGLSIDFSPSDTGLSKIILGNNLADALNIAESTNSYLKFVTTTGSEKIVLGKDVEIAGDLTAATITGDVNFDSNTLFIDESENKVGIGLNNPAKLFHTEGSVASDFVGRFKNTNSAGEGLQIHADNTNALFRALDVRNSNGQIFQIYNDGNIVIKGDGSDQTTKWHTGSAYVNAKLDVRQLAIAFSGSDKVTSNTSGNFTFAENMSIVKSNDGGDVSFTIKNSAGAGSTDETSSIQFTTTSSGHATAAVIGARQSNYNDSASRDGELKLQASENGSLGSKLILRGSEAEFFTNVGIGSAPLNSGGMSRQLEVTATSDAQIALRATADLSGTARIGDLAWYTNHGSTPQVASIQGTVQNGNENEGRLTFHTRNGEAGGAPLTRMTLNNRGNLGIGVTPDETNTNYDCLQVGGNASILSFGTQGASGEVDFNHNVHYNQAGNYVYQSTDEATRYRQGSGRHIWYSASSGTAGNTISFTERLRIDQNGTIGINVESPTQDAMLHIKKDQAAYTRFIVENTTTATAAQALGSFISDAGTLFMGITSSSHAASGDAIINQTASGKGFKIITGGSDAMRIASDGNVGIGTNSPSSVLRLGQKLAVSASGGTDRGGMSINSFHNNSNAPLLDFNKSRNTTDNAHTRINSGDSTGVIVFRGSDGDEFVDSCAISAEVDGSTNNNVMPGRLMFFTTPDSNALSERMRIDSDGNLGIGTSNPRSKFHVEDATNRGVRFFSKSTTGIGAGTNTTPIGTFSTKYDGTGNGHACMVDAVVTARVSQGANHTSVRTVALRLLIARSGNEGGGDNTNSNATIIETSSSVLAETGSAGTMQSISFKFQHDNGSSIVDGVPSNSSSTHNILLSATTTIDTGAGCAIDFIGMIYGNETIEFS